VSRYIPCEMYETGEVVDPTMINRSLQRAGEAYNGTIDCLQIKEAIVNSAKLADQSCNQYHNHTSPFGGGGGVLTLERGDLTSRNWTFPAAAQLTWTADEDGVIVGELNFAVRCFLQNVTDKAFGWSVGVFQDGTLLGRIDKVIPQYWSGGLPFHGVVTKGSHTIQLGVKAYAYSASLASDPNDAITIFSSQLWWRHAKR